MCARGPVVLDSDGDLGAFYQLQQCLLNTLSAYVSSVDGFFSSDLVKLVEDNDSMLGGLNVVVGFDEETLDAGFDVLADVACLGEGVAVADSEGDVEFFAEGSARL